MRRLAVIATVVCGLIASSGDAVHAACGDVAGAYAGGAGTAGDPYLIATPAQFERLRTDTANHDKSFRLTADIDMGGCTWATPIERFSGVLDGDYHVVSNLVITTVSLISDLRPNAIVRNMGLDVTLNYVVSSDRTDTTRFALVHYVGGLVGVVRANALVENSWVSGSITSDVTYVQRGSAGGATLQDAAVGGLAGVVEGVVEDSYSTASVSSTLRTTMTVDGDVTVTHYVGGVVGWAATTSQSLNRLYGTATALSIGTATTSQMGVQTVTPAFGAFLGFNTNSPTPPVIAASVWNSAAFGTGVGSGVATGASGKTVAELKDFATFGPVGLAWDITDGWSAATTWSMCRQVNSGFPFHSGRYTTNPCVDPPGEPEPAALPWTPRILDIVVRDGSVEVTFERVHMRQTTRWYEVQSLTSGTCRALHESVGATGTCVFDTRRTNAREQFRVIAHNAYGASDPSAWTPIAGVVVGRIAASPPPATTPAKPVASCPNGAPRTVTSGVRDVIDIDGAQCPVSVSVTPLRELGVAIAVPANGVASTYTLVASRRGGASVRRVWSAPNPGTLRTRIGPVKSGDWTLRLEVRSAEGRVTSWTSPVVRVP